jgi:hypothetical protein
VDVVDFLAVQLSGEMRYGVKVARHRQRLAGAEPEQAQYQKKQLTASQWASDKHPAYCRGSLG